MINSDKAYAFVTDQVDGDLFWGRPSPADQPHIKYL